MLFRVMGYLTSYLFSLSLEKYYSEGEMRAFKFDKSVKIKAAGIVIKLYIFGRASN